MSEKRKSAAGRSIGTSVIIINNLDYPVRYAAWFGKKRSKAAIEAAEKSEFYTLAVESPETNALLSRLPEGALEDGTPRLSPIDGEIAAQLEALLLAQHADPRAELPAPDVDPSANPESDPGQSITQAWTMLRPGSFVLAADLDRQGIPDAWYEAEIISVDGAEITLRWRDFPREGLLSRTRRHIALLHPAH